MNKKKKKKNEEKKTVQVTKAYVNTYLNFDYKYKGGKK
jgi:hypothetical protein